MIIVKKHRRKLKNGRYITIKQYRRKGRKAMKKQRISQKKFAELAIDRKGMPKNSKFTQEEFLRRINEQDRILKEKKNRGMAQFKMKDIGKATNKRLQKKFNLPTNIETIELYDAVSTKDDINNLSADDITLTPVLAARTNRGEIIQIPLIPGIDLSQDTKKRMDRKVELSKVYSDELKPRILTRVESPEAIVRIAEVSEADNLSSLGRDAKKIAPALNRLTSAETDRVDNKAAEDVQFFGFPYIAVGKTEGPEQQKEMKRLSKKKNRGSTPESRERVRQKMEEGK